MNVAELKVENSFLKKKNENQKLIISTQSVIIEKTELKANILTKQIKETAKTGKKKWWDGFGKGVLTGGVVILGYILSTN